MQRTAARGQRWTTRGCGVLAGVVLMLCFGTRAEAQMAKQGTYTARFGWSAIGKTIELEKDHMIFVGEYSGVVFNDAGSGFMHGTSWVCPGLNDFVHGLSTAAQGYCVATDKDGDKAFVTWKGHKATEPNKGGGEFHIPSDLVVDNGPQMVKAAHTVISCFFMTFAQHQIV